MYRIIKAIPFVTIKYTLLIMNQGLNDKVSGYLKKKKIIGFFFFYRNIWDDKNILYTCDTSFDTHAKITVNKFGKVVIFFVSLK